MDLKIKQQWTVNGELCVEGIYKGMHFGAVHIDTDIDYGWQALSYLPEYPEQRAGCFDNLVDAYMEEFTDELDAFRAILLEANNAEGISSALNTAT